MCLCIIYLRLRGAKWVHGASGINKAVGSFRRADASGFVQHKVSGRSASSCRFLF